MKALLTIALILTLSGCVTSPPKVETNYVADPSHSVGWNMLKASGVTEMNAFKEVEISDEAYEEMAGKGVIKSGVRSVVVAGGATTALVAGAGSSLSSIRGLPVGQIFLGGIVSSMVAPSAPMMKDRAMYWIPESMASNEDEAQEVLRQALLEATMNIADKHDSTLVMHGPVFGTKEEKLRLDTAICYEFNCLASTSSDSYDYRNPADVDFKLVKRPDFVKGSSERVWSGRFDGVIWEEQFKCSKFKVEPENRALCEYHNETIKSTFHKALPEWIYRYSFDVDKRMGVVYQEQTGAVFPLVIKSES